MRTETEIFESAGSDVMAFKHDDEVRICFGLYASESLTKQQAAEFARQLLEICGEQ